MGMLDRPAACSLPPCMFMWQLGRARYRPFLQANICCTLVLIHVLCLRSCATLYFIRTCSCREPALQPTSACGRRIPWRRCPHSLRKPPDPSCCRPQRRPWRWWRRYKHPQQEPSHCSFCQQRQHWPAGWIQARARGRDRGGRACCQEGMQLLALMTTKVLAFCTVLRLVSSLILCGTCSCTIPHPRKWSHSYRVQRKCLCPAPPSNAIASGPVCLWR